MENGLEPDQMVTCYLVHLIGCALSNREPEVLPDGLSWEDVVSRARDNSVLGLIWHAARWLDGIPGGVRESCQRFSDMVALHNVRYEAERTAVRFRPLTAAEIHSYIRTGECMDKAGAYGIQDRGALLVEGIEGDFFNVMGLPVLRLARMLERFGLDLLGKESVP